MRNEVFIVTTSEGAKVVSARVLAQDVKEAFAEQKTEYKRCDLESICEELIKEYTGKSVMKEHYDNLIDVIGKSVISYANLTPYQYMKFLLAQNQTASAKK